MSDVKVVGGTTREIAMQAGATGRKFDFERHPLLKDPQMAFRCFAAWATERKRGDIAAGQRWAAGIYKGVYDRWPPRAWNEIPIARELATFEVESFCRREMSRYSKRRDAA